ncbi:MAG: glycosyltransferase family 4 protein [Burkholderiaceae bacterium]
MRLLVLSFYFAPDLSAGSFRTTALVRALAAAAPHARIDVVTALPNRYRSFDVEAPEHEAHDNVQVRRFALPEHASGMLDQSRAFASFAAQVLRHTKGRRYDLVYATSSRLMTAALGAFVARRVGGRLYLDIRDIFVDTIRDVLPRSLATLAYPVFSLLERWTMDRADHINLVSPGFAEYFRRRYPQRRLSFFTNGIDDEFVAAAAAPTPPRPGRSGPATILYAGNLGEGQGLHAVVPALARALRGRARFVIIGDGGRREALQAGVAGIDNVEIRAPVRRDALIAAYRESDVLFLHLNDYEAFRKVLPSKLFEYAAMGKPILAGVAGQAADFIRSEIENAAVFPPCDAAQAVAAFDSLAMHDAPRPAFVKKFARSRIMAAMAGEILEVAA